MLNWFLVTNLAIPGLTFLSAAWHFSDLYDLTHHSPRGAIASRVPEGAGDPALPPVHVVSTCFLSCSHTVLKTLPKAQKQRTTQPWVLQAELRFVSHSGQSRNPPIPASRAKFKTTGAPPSHLWTPFRISARKYMMGGEGEGRDISSWERNCRGSQKT